VKTDKYVFDSYALLSFFQDEKGAATVREILYAANAGKAVTFLSSINWGELHYILYRRRGIQKAEEVLLLLELLPVSIIEIDRDTIRRAALIKAGHSLSYADCFTSALAESMQAKIVTGDPEFKQIKNPAGFIWL